MNTPKRVTSHRPIARGTPRPKPTPFVWKIGVARRRIQLVVCLAIFAFGFLGYRAVAVQVVQGNSYRADGVAQRESFTKIPAARGSIFDRDGNEMAITIPALSLYANPQAVLDPMATAHVLAQLLGIDAPGESELSSKLTDKSQTFVYVQRFVDQAVADAVLSLHLAGVNGVSEPKRIQVAGGLAMNIIGRTDPFGVGSTGLELQYDKMLRGQDGKSVKQAAQGRSLPGTSHIVTEAHPGVDLILTIDRSMQYQAEKALLSQVDRLQARGGNAVILDTKSGEILTIVSVRRNAEGIAVLSQGNLAAVESHEPGSVAKVFSIAATIDSGVANPQTMYQVPGTYIFDPGTEFEKKINDAYPHEVEEMSLRDIIVHSSNIGTLMAASAVGSERMHDYLQNFGFGSPTDLQFPGESSGKLKQAKNWRGSENATIAYGYGFSTTSLQLVAAVNVVANGGVYVAPRLIKSTIDDKGSVWDAPMGANRRVISQETAKTMVDLLTGVVCEGTGSRAKLKGISVAGKTGTGYKIQDNGTYEGDIGKKKYFATFVGFLPAQNPEVTILVSIDEPDPSSRDRFGGTAAAPVFAELAQVAIHERAIQPTLGDTGCPVLG